MEDNNYFNSLAMFNNRDDKYVIFRFFFCYLWITIFLHSRIFFLMLALNSKSLKCWKINCESREIVWPTAIRRRICFFYDQSVKTILKLLISVFNELRMEIGELSHAEFNHHGDLIYYYLLTKWLNKLSIGELLLLLLT